MSTGPDLYTGKYKTLTRVLNYACTVQCGKFRSYDIVVIDKTDSLAIIYRLGVGRTRPIFIKIRSAEIW